MSFINDVKNELLANQPKDNLQQYVRDIFLTKAKSSITIGSGAGYNIAFTFDNIDEARIFADILAVYEIFPKLHPASTGSLVNQSGKANDKALVTIKDRESVCNLLALVSANKSLLNLNNEIAMRELRNTANRRANCDTHNIGRTVTTASGQLEKIRLLNLDNLNDKLKQVAQARLDHPDASYEELSKILNLTKSGVVHRLRKLCN